MQPHTGHIEAHGGFELGTEMGVALRGMGREPINTWMPLYINKEHWLAFFRMHVS